MAEIRFYNVHILTTPDDEGYCLTFDDIDQARDCARWHRDNGVFYVALRRA